MTVLDPQVSRPDALKGERGGGLTLANWKSFSTSWRQIEQGNRGGLESQREYRGGPPRQYHGHTRDSQNGRAGGLRDSKRPGEFAVNRRDFLVTSISAGLTTAVAPAWAFANLASSVGFRLADVTSAAGIQFRHNSGAYGGKLLPETLGSGCAFLDYDSDGWQDILLVNGMDWPGHKRERSTLRLYRNNRNGTFTDVTRSAGLDVEMYGMGVAVGDYNNDGFPDIFITCVGQSRLFRNTGKGTFVDATRSSGLFGIKALALRRCGSITTATACWIIRVQLRALVS